MRANDLPQQVDLNFLNFEESFAVLAQEVVELFMEVADFQFCLEIDLVVALRAKAVARGLVALTHHDDRCLQRGQTNAQIFGSPSLNAVRRLTRWCK